MKGNDYDLKISRNSAYNIFFLCSTNHLLMKEFSDKRFHEVEVQFEALKCSTIPNFHSFLKVGKYSENRKCPIFLQNKITRNIIISY